jgi:hypothetical protein
MVTAPCIDKVCNWQCFANYVFLYKYLACVIDFGVHLLQMNIFPFQGTFAEGVIALLRAEMIHFCIPLNIHNFKIIFKLK